MRAERNIEVRFKFVGVRAPRRVKALLYLAAKEARRLKFDSEVVPADTEKELADALPEDAEPTPTTPTTAPVPTTTSAPPTTTTVPPTITSAPPTTTSAPPTPRRPPRSRARSQKRAEIKATPDASLHPSRGREYSRTGWGTQGQAQGQGSPDARRARNNARFEVVLTARPPNGGILGGRCRRRTWKWCARLWKSSIVADWVAWESHWHREAEWYDPPEVPGSGVHRGLPSIRRYFDELIEIGAEGWSVEVEAIESVGRDRVLIRARSVLVGRESGIPIEDALFQVVDLEDGRVRRVRNFRSSREALGAVGLRE